jgi:uncharacterized membrane protein (DUF485 family)
MHIIFVILLILILEKLPRNNQPIFLEFLNQFRSFSLFFLGVFLFFYVVLSIFFSVAQFRNYVTEHKGEYYAVSKNGVRKEKISKYDYLIQKGSSSRIFESYWVLVSYASFVVFMSRKPKKVLPDTKNTEPSSSAS